jgi:hypothetical protein
MNFDKITHLTDNATDGVTFAIKREKEKAVEAFLNVCRREIKKHNSEFRSMRLEAIKDENTYGSIIDEEMSSRIRMIVNCLEKMYTFSKHPQGLSLNQLKKKMEGVLNTSIFDNEYSKLKLPESSWPLPADEVKKGLYFMLDVKKTREYERMVKNNPKRTKDNTKYMFFTYILDKTDLNFEYNPYEIIHSEHLVKEKELRTMLTDVTAAM